MDAQDSHAVRSSAPSSPSSLHELLIQSATALKLSLEPEALNSPESSSYLVRLASLPLSKLNAEPAELQHAATNLDADISLLCFREFRTFLLAHDATTAVKHTFNKLTHSLDKLLEDTSRLSSLIHAFPASANPILQDRRQMALVLSHLGPIENLLELPQLVSTCVNARLWNEAMELALRVRELDMNMPAQSSQSPPSDPQVRGVGVLRHIRSEVDSVLQSLRDNMINDLKDRGLKLPLAVRTIGVLRRMSTLFSPGSSSLPIQSLTEPELRVTFLASRCQCLTDSLQQLQLSTGFLVSSTLSSPSNLLELEHSSQPSLQLNEERLKFLRRWIETWRELVGDTVSIYSEIFFASRSASLFNPIHSSTPSRAYPSHFLKNAVTPLDFFATQAINLLLSTLDHHVKLLVSITSLSSLLTQLSYCAAAFAKWGMDFTGAIRPIFVRSLEVLVKLRMDAGVQQLQQALKLNPTSAPTSAPSNKTAFQTRRRSLHPLSTTTFSVEERLISSDALRQVLAIDLDRQLPAGSAAPTAFPPHILTLFVPLARFVNSQFAALNELRLMPVKDSYDTISHHQLRVLKAANEEMRRLLLSISPPSLNCPSQTNAEFSDNLEKKNAPGASDNVREVTYRMMVIWARHVLPLLERSLRVDIYADLHKEPADQFILLLNDAESLVASSKGGLKRPGEDSVLQSVKLPLPTTDYETVEMHGSPVVRQEHETQNISTTAETKEKLSLEVP